MYVNRTVHTTVSVLSSMFVLLSLCVLYWEHRRNEMIVCTAATIVSAAGVSYIMYSRPFMLKQLHSLR